MRRNFSIKSRCLQTQFVFVVVSMMAYFTTTTMAAENPQTLALPDLREDAIRLVQIASRDNDPVLRANAIEAMQSVPDRAMAVAQLGLDDENPLVRFTALVTIGKMRLHELGPAAARLLNDENDSVRAAAMFAARLCGQEVDISEMSEMLASPDPSVRGNVVMLLGMMGDPSALPMIEYQSKAPMPSQHVDNLRRTLVRVQIAEAQVLLGDTEAASPLRAAAYSEFDEVRVMAVTMLGRLRDVSTETALIAMVTRQDHPAELRLAAFAAVANMGGRASIRQLLEESAFVLDMCGSENPVLRSQAIMTAGALENARVRIYRQLLPSDPPHIWRLFENQDLVAMLARMLEDPHSQVRLSAAAAVLRAL